MKAPVRATWFVAVVLLSWPPMIASALWAERLVVVLALNVGAMLGAATATWIHARLRGESLASAQWRAPSIRSLLAIFGFCLVLWWLPAAIDLATGARRLSEVHFAEGERAVTILGAVAYLALLPIAGFGEELAWRGYLLPRLLPGGSRKAMAIVGVVWGLWHGPLLVFGMLRRGEGGLVHSLLGGLGTLCVTTLLTIPLSAVFAFVWRRAGSIFAVAFLHGEYDGLRDVAGFLLKGKPGPLSFLPAGVITLAGLWILIRGLPEASNGDAPA